MNNKTFTLLALAALSAGSLSARGEYDEIARLQAMNERVQGIRSMADGEHYTTLENNDIRRYAYATASEGVSLLPSPAPNLAISDYAFSPDERMILIASGRTPIYRHSYTTQYHLLADGRIRPGLQEAEAPRDASFSPDGRKIAYSDRNDLYVWDIATGKTRRITDDGAWNAVINGTTDWVYEEEFGTTRAYAFSPDGGQLAFLRFDESEVPLMEMMRFDGKLYNEAYSFKYPKAGEKNSAVQLWVADLATGRTEVMARLPRSEFGEGIALLGGKLYQLTWQSNTAPVYSLEDGKLRKIHDFRYPGEGWGLTTDGEKLYMSDGTANIYTLDPATFKREKRTTVTLRGETLNFLNELEWIAGKI